MTPVNLALAQRVAAHFEGRWRQGYVRGKISGDPAYAAVAEQLGESSLPVLDIGCGMGLLAFYLRETGFSALVVGWDFDERKIAAARRAAEAGGYGGMDFQLRDVREPAPFSGNVIMLDVLHYLPQEVQAALLPCMAAMVAPGGVCVLRGTPRDRSWRFRVTQIEECFLVGSGWLRAGRLHHLTVPEITAPFARAGLSVEVRPLWGGTPFNSHLFIFRRAQ